MTIGKFIAVGNVKLWTETFGDKKDRAVLLMMGNSSQGIMWTDEFCQRFCGAAALRYSL